MTKEKALNLAREVRPQELRVGSLGTQPGAHEKPPPAGAGPIQGLPLTVHAAPGSLGKITFGGLRGQDWVGLRFERRKIFLDPARLASSYHLDSIGMPFVPPSLGVIATPAMASAVEKSPADQKTLDFGHKSVAEHPRQGQVLWAIETIPDCN
jgi:hypothetical protein